MLVGVDPIVADSVIDVNVQVHKARTDDHVGGIDLAASQTRVQMGFDAADTAVGDRDVRSLVQMLGGIDYRSTRY